MDVYELARSFAVSVDVAATLTAYGRVRLEAAQQHATMSKQESRRFLKSGARRIAP
jgi:hypothetical protein